MADVASVKLQDSAFAPKSYRDFNGLRYIRQTAMNFPG